MLHVPSPSIDVVDTTGAGDAFDAGLIDAVLDRGRPGGNAAARPRPAELYRPGCAGALNGLADAAGTGEASMSNRKVTLIGGGGVRTPLVIFGVNESSRAPGRR